MAKEARRKRKEKTKSAGNGKKGARQNKSGQVGQIITPKGKSEVRTDHVQSSRRMGGMSLGGRMGNVRQGVAREEDSNASAYANLLLNPFAETGEPIRIPDLLSWPSATATLKEKYTFYVEPSADVAGAGPRQVFFTPCLTPFSGDVHPTTTATPFIAWHDARNTSTWLSPWGTGRNSVWASTMGGMAQSYRTVAFGVRILPVGKLMDRSGRIACGLVFNPAAEFPAGSPVARFESFSGSRTITANSDDADGLTVTWRPGDYAQALDFRLTSDATPRGSILFEFGDVPVRQEYTAEIVHHIEYQPFPSAAPLFDLRAASGSESATSMAIESAFKVIGEGATSMVYTASEVARFAPKIASVVSQVARAGSLVAGALGFAAQARLYAREGPEGPRRAAEHRELQQALWEEYCSKLLEGQQRLEARYERAMERRVTQARIAVSEADSEGEDDFASVTSRRRDATPRPARKL